MKDWNERKGSKKGKQNKQKLKTQGENLIAFKRSKLYFKNQSNKIKLIQTASFMTTHHI